MCMKARVISKRVYYETLKSLTGRRSTMTAFPHYRFRPMRFKTKLAMNVKAGDTINVKFSNDIKGLLGDMPGKKYIVGGAPRDILSGGKIHDVDIATDQDIDHVEKVLSEKGYHVLQVGKAFGIIKVKLPNGEDVDVAQFRADTYLPHDRHPITRRVQTIEEDLGRREAPVNAMALESLGGDSFRIIDPHGGIQDLKEGRMRAVGNPEERITEDPLRMLRYAGIGAQKNLEIDPDLARAIKENVNKLDDVSKERLSEELTKRFEKAEPHVYFKNMGEVGLLEYLFPEFKQAKTTVHDARGSHRGETVYEHSHDVLSRLPKDASTRLKIAAMLHDTAKPETMEVEGEKIRFIGHDVKGAEVARKRLNELRFSRADQQYAASLIAHHMEINEVTRLEHKEKPMAKLVIAMGEDYPRLNDLLTLAEADQGKKFPVERGMLKKWENTPPAIKGVDIEDVEPKQIRGPLLRQMRYIQLTQNLTREQLLGGRLRGEAHNLRENLKSK